MQKPLAIIVESIEYAGPRPEVAYPDAGDFLPVAAISAVSILLSVLWLLIIGKYTSSKRGNV